MAGVRVKVSDYVTYLTNPKLRRVAWVRVRVCSRRRGEDTIKFVTCARAQNARAAHANA